MTTKPSSLLVTGGCGFIGSHLIELLLKDIYPYIYLSIIFVIISFLLILGIFVLLMRNKFLYKNHR